MPPALDHNHQQAFYTIFELVYTNGAEVRPRGKLVKELLNFDYNFPLSCRFMNFKHRNLNLDYIRAELRWYLRGNQYDQSIMDHAKLWKGLAQPDGAILSNYGHYLFQQRGLLSAYTELLQDHDSRRAVVPILRLEHCLIGNPDVPCTLYIGFIIRKGRLICNVRMRSQDVIWGLGNDLPFFSVVHEIMYRCLMLAGLDLELGHLNLRVDSLHLYERHFELIAAILEDPEFKAIMIPPIGGSEAGSLLYGELNDDTCAFSRWLRYG